VRRPAAQLVARASAEGGPLSPLSQELLARYVGLIAWEHLAPPWGVRDELKRLRALRRGLEQTRIVQVDVDSLDRLAAATMSSPTAAEMLRSAVNRLRRDLQDGGELPSPEEIGAVRRIARITAELAGPSRQILSAWLAERAETLAPHQLATEARFLAVLEKMAAKEPDPDEALVPLWIVELAHQVVNCPHRWSTDHGPRCPACGATPRSHGTHASPVQKHQEALERVGIRYLAARRRLS
jgi:hypothetical protein